MRGIVLWLALLCVAHVALCPPAAAQFAPAPTNFLATGFNYSASAAYWQPCSISSTAATVDYNAIINYQCTGTQLMIGCLDSSQLHPVVAAAPRTAWLSNGTFVNNTYAPYNNFTVATNASVLYAGPAVPSICTAASGASICFPLSGASLAVGAYCGTGLGFVVSSSVFRVFYTNPCEGSAVNASCSSVLGQCGLNATCSAAGTCDAIEKQPDPPTCVDMSSCDPATGVLTTTYRAAGDICSLNNSCVSSAVCAANHTCLPATYTTCPYLGRCYDLGTCNLTTQTCQYVQQPNGTACSFATSCYGPGTCAGNGSCVAEAVAAGTSTCGVPSLCSDFAGGWLYTPAPNGTSCVSTNLCMANSTCNGVTQYQAGCTYGDPVVCPQLPCRGPPHCVNNTGLCVSDALPQNTPCDDGDPCTQGTKCGLIATCGGGVPAIACPSNPPQCKAYARTPLNATTCVCTLVDAANGTSCDDGNICTDNDRCTTGVCGGTAKLCPGDDCNYPLGVCSPSSGCYNPRPDLLPCNSTCMIDGYCSNSTCIGGTFNAANPSCTPGVARRVQAALSAWLDDDYVGMAKHALWNGLCAVHGAFLDTAMDAADGASVVADALWLRGDAKTKQHKKRE